MKDLGQRDAPPRMPSQVLGTRKYPGADFVRDSFTKALEDEQGGPKAFDWWRDLARAQLLEGDNRGAQESFQKAYQVDRRRFDDDMMAGLAEAQHREGRVNEAMKNYKKAMELNNENSRYVSPNVLTNEVLAPNNQPTKFPSLGGPFHHSFPPP